MTEVGISIERSPESPGTIFQSRNISLVKSGKSYYDDKSAVIRFMMGILKAEI